MPVIVTLQSLDKETLKRILTEPKNAIIKQYKKLFEYDKVELEFNDEALMRLLKLQFRERPEQED